jgi:hypothetical protein
VCRNLRWSTRTILASSTTAHGACLLQWRPCRKTAPTLVRPMRYFLKLGWSLLFISSCVLLAVLSARTYHDWEFTKLQVTDTQVLRIDSGRGLTVWRLEKHPPHWHYSHWLKSDPQVPLSLAALKTKTRNYLSIPEPRKFVMPYYVPIALAGLLSVVPWLTWRFSVRTLLLVTTMVAITVWSVTCTNP